MGPVYTDVFATVAKAFFLDGMVDAGILKSKGGKVRLLAPEELPDSWPGNSAARRKSPASWRTGSIPFASERNGRRKPWHIMGWCRVGRRSRRSCGRGLRDGPPKRGCSSEANVSFRTTQGYHNVSLT